MSDEIRSGNKNVQKQMDEFREQERLMEEAERDRKRNESIFDRISKAYQRIRRRGGFIED